MDYHVVYKNWLGHIIRMLNLKGTWYAIGKDIALALDYEDTKQAIRKNCKYVKFVRQSTILKRLPKSIPQDCVDIMFIV
jgi:prophage antirepressor-like protein